VILGDDASASANLSPEIFSVIAPRRASNQLRVSVGWTLQLGLLAYGGTSFLVSITSTDTTH